MMSHQLNSDAQIDWLSMV